MEQGGPKRNPLETPQDPQSQSSTERRVCPKCGLNLSSEIVICPNDGTILANQADLGGKLLDQYEFIAEIGSGGMGVIYKARHKELKQFVAIKMLHMNRLDEKNVRRFHQEARAVTALDHPSIVRVRDFGVTENGQPHMVLDFISGESLADKIQKIGALPVSEALPIFVQITSALEHAHSRGVLHRDLKPSNVMLEEETGVTEVKIVDFGIAKIADMQQTDADLNLTQSGDVFGSPLYMSPEQASGARLDQRSDIYSLGCLMYETLTGSPPFVGGSSIEIIFRQKNSPAPSLQEGSLGKEFSLKLEAIIAKTLKKDPADRFQTMADLGDSLTQLLEGKQEQSARLSPLSDAELDPEQQKKLRVHSAVLACLSLLAVAMIGLVVTSFSKVKPDVNTAQMQRSTKEELEEKLKAPKVDLHGSKLSDTALEFFQTPTNTNSVDLSGTLVSGPGLANLIHLPLKKLNLAGTQISTRALEEICNMTNLESLDLSDTAISDIEIDRLQTLQNLKEVNFANDQVGLATCRLVKNFWKNLEVANFDHTLITDKELRFFNKAPLLKKLSVKECSLSTEALRRLAKNRPDLEIIASNFSARPTTDPANPSAPLSDATRNAVDAAQNAVDTTTNSVHSNATESEQR